jgi:hypothetical protein
MNVMHGASRESHELLHHAITDIFFDPGREFLKHKVVKNLAGESVGVPVASILSLQQHHLFKVLVQLLYRQIYSR